MNRIIQQKQTHLVVFDGKGSKKICSRNYLKKWHRVKTSETDAIVDCQKCLLFMDSIKAEL